LRQPARDRRGEGRLTDVRVHLFAVMLVTVRFELSLFFLPS
jgi:hypothetical protein